MPAPNGFSCKLGGGVSFGLRFGIINRVSSRATHATLPRLGRHRICGVAFLDTNLPVNNVKLIKKYYPRASRSISERNGGRSNSSLQAAWRKYEDCVLSSPQHSGWFVFSECSRLFGFGGSEGRDGFILAYIRTCRCGLQWPIGNAALQQSVQGEIPFIRSAVIMRAAKWAESPDE